MKLTFPINTTGGSSVYGIVGTLGTGWERRGLRRMQWGRVPFRGRLTKDILYLQFFVEIRGNFNGSWIKS